MAVEEEPAPGIPEWVVTFGDMMSLLLTFFIMLVSMSEMKEDEKFQAMVESFRQQFGAHEFGKEMVPGESRSRGAQMPNPIYSMGRSQKKDIKNGGQEVKAVVGDHEKVQIVRPGDDSSIGGVIYFDENATDLTEDNKRDLIRIIEQLAGKPQKIEIRGHTSRKPVDPKSGIQDLWDLADRRVHSTMKFLIEQGIEPNRIRLGNAEAHEPLYNGVDPDRLKKNSRVQILMWDERVSDLDGSLRPAVMNSPTL
ncbi:OmpA/MotB family protein [Bythopirellula polymerisocia]|uniref:Motility protein B n=1 Tax=Bythopirellula polymerisocia TaxID=2528003 RepID=A0A5C6CYU4_9BACT|nr:flagellar motor protein MotB [Bythopirellula polymerisocia]TWU27809.1 Motility protein B [Bythopirellula polymerisocia]